MIERAEMIAVISIAEVVTRNTQRKTWIYRQTAMARTEVVLEGRLPEEFQIYGMETFICAQCPVGVGGGKLALVATTDQGGRGRLGRR